MDKTGSARKNASKGDTEQAGLNPATIDKVKGRIVSGKINEAV